MTFQETCRSWGVARITTLSEISSPNRLAASATRLSVQIFLVICLWRALYAHTDVSGGLTKAQAVTYAVLAVLSMRIRGSQHWSARDTVIQHVQYGTIIYWFLRPLSARRYYFRRQVGDQLYGLTWALAGYLVCRAANLISGSASAKNAFAFLITLLLGQFIMYYLVLITDLLCFWIIRNTSVVSILNFAQNLLAGGYAALWYFPGWFQAADTVLPFQYILGVPLSFYVGRLSPTALPLQLSAQGSWILGLAFLTYLLWRRTALRVVSQGG